MKKCIAIILSLVILSLSVKDLAIYLSFKANQTYISEFLCVNRSQSDNCCKGKCFLKKTLQDQRDAEEKYPLSNKEDNAKEYYYTKILTELTDNQLVINKSKIPFHNKIHPQLYQNEVFHPPTLA